VKEDCKTRYITFVLPSIKYVATVWLDVMCRRMNICCFTCIEVTTHSITVPIRAVQNTNSSFTYKKRGKLESTSS
jgi:hypothetical protein